MRKTVRNSFRLIALFIVLPMFLSSCAAQTEDGPPEFSAPATGKAPSSVYAPAEATEGTLPDKDELFFEGDLARTDVIRYAAASLTITDETETGFNFALTAYWGDHSGEPSGEATNNKRRESCLSYCRQRRSRRRHSPVFGIPATES